jgi:hypothetical protein
MATANQRRPSGQILGNTFVDAGEKIILKTAIKTAGHPQLQTFSFRNMAKPNPQRSQSGCC